MKGPTELRPCYAQGCVPCMPLYCVLMSLVAAARPVACHKLRFCAAAETVHHTWPAAPCCNVMRSIRSIRDTAHGQNFTQHGKLSRCSQSPVIVGPCPADSCMVIEDATTQGPQVPS